MNNLVVRRSQLVEAQIVGTPATGKRYQFTEIPNISRNNVTLYGFEAFTATQLVTSPNNNAVITSAVQDQITLTLVDNNNNELIYQLPYYSAIRSLNGGFPFVVKPMILNLTRSYIQLTDATGVTANSVALLNIYYQIIGE